MYKHLLIVGGLIIGTVGLTAPAIAASTSPHNQLRNIIYLHCTTVQNRPASLCHKSTAQQMKNHSAYAREEYKACLAEPGATREICDAERDYFWNNLIIRFS